jgi:hypothetical protein
MAREQAIADNTRAEEALNGFIAAKQAALFEAPGAYYRTQGSDAINAAPTILETLSRLRDDSLDGLANDAQRKRLGSALDAHLNWRATTSPATWPSRAWHGNARPHRTASRS